MTDLVIRPLEAGEEQLFASLPDPGLVGFAAFGDDYLTMVARGEYHPEWTWVAQRDGVVVARAAWWGGPDDTKPLALDWFDFVDDEAAVRLLRTAPYGVEYNIKAPPGWRDKPSVRHEVERRMDAAERAGMRLLVERYRYEWTPACGLPDRPGRLVLRPEPDDEAVLAAMRRVQPGSLDAHARRVADEAGPDAAAEDEFRELQWLPGPREWWRLAYTADGELAGMVMPSRNHSDPIVAFVAVVPEQRGNGYAYELLAEATHLLAAEGAEKIAAATDLTNTPMAAAFAKAGYPIAQIRIDLV